jgi:hypothetical protein
VSKAAHQLCMRRAVSKPRLVSVPPFQVHAAVAQLQSPEPSLAVWLHVLASGLAGALVLQVM